jgi:cystinosin
MSVIDYVVPGLGIAYTIIWSVSFYFQAHLIYKVKHGGGYSLDFQVLNIIGFGFYSVSNVYYLMTNGSSFSSIMDLAFAVHAFLISVVIMIQTFYYPRHANKGHTSVYLIIGLVVTMTLIYYYLNENYVHGKSKDVWIFMGLSKSLISTTKYCYQIFLNYERQSCHGFSISNVKLDITGGLLSLTQDLLRMFVLDIDIFSEKSNIPKFALSIVVIFFDLLFFFQYYVLYRDHDEKPVDKDGEVLLDKSQ